METENIIVLNTCPNEASARQIATTLVEEGLAACINITANITSVYRWQGKIETEQECLLVIKTDRPHYPALEQRIVTLHPYELPEIVAVPLVAGLPPYLDWLTASLSAAPIETK